MDLVEFPEQTVVIAKNQPQYRPLPAYVQPRDPEGRVICCWQLTVRERLRLLFTGRIWHHIRDFPDSMSCPRYEREPGVD